ncbi:hypothetical protein [Xylophilus ampelinus]|uniref:Big-1 domain-containing protein n=1 Tax=Xylophilus ampelinus TaxID=54067 RepID=A0A318SLW3_9BURK|nr:hypothetical protein [Xylophilus ampelinus]MCS4510106.1 hypothetical protein [Xylophilus ampelinus]PYE78255.1 hypothetical protein DFQ15_10844 [Xylophilus ampelinus]
MKKLLRGFLAFALTWLLASCGGGGGSSGSGNFGATPTTPVTTTPTLTVSIVDSSNAAVGGNTIGSTSYARATLKTAAGIGIADKLITFTTNDSAATLAQASGLTDAQGIVRVKISPALLSSAAAGTVTATATFDNATITGSTDFQVSATNVSLASFVVSPSTITALQSAAVNAQVLVNGSAATAGQVQVALSASCGTFSPSSVTTSSSGTIASVYQSLGTCSGPVTLTAQPTNGPAMTTTLSVIAARAANLLFDSADQTLIYTSKATSGVKQATLKFKVVNSANQAMASQPVSFSLSSTAINAGVTFAGGVMQTQVVSTDANGFASITVSAGALPTPVIVTGALVSDPSLTASSLTLAVTSGVPAQDKSSLAAEKLSIQGFDIDGVTTNITFRVSDRQSNPVPANTAVTFVASAGTIQGSCVLDANSSCVVVYTSSGTRPSNGRVAILAYIDGEEGFVDTNGNNYYDSADAVETSNARSRFDVGTVFRDDNEDGFRQGNEQTYPGGTIGTGACPSINGAPSVQNTCDGVWTSNIRVRQQVVIALATTVIDAMVDTVKWSNSGFDVVISDRNGNSAPTGTKVEASIANTDSKCTITSVSPDVVSSVNRPTTHSIIFNGDATCAQAQVNITTTTPLGTKRVIQFSKT